MSYSHGKTLIRIAVTEDHTMFREALCTLINDWKNCKVIIQASNGKQLIEQIDPKNLPDLVLIDLCMPEMNGYETIKILKVSYPLIKFLVISMYQSEEGLLMILKSGAEGFIHKTADSIRLKKAVYEIMRSGYFFTDNAASRFIKQSMQNNDGKLRNDLSNKELAFLKHIITEKTYKQIADDMSISPRQVEYLRNFMFEKFGVQSRTGLAVKSIEKGLII